MLYLIGLGLGDAKDITVKGLKVVKAAHKVFLEAYTSIIRGGKEELVSRLSSSSVSLSVIQSDFLTHNFKSICFYHFGYIISERVGKFHQPNR